MADTELKKCPFCESDDLNNAEHKSISAGNECYVECNICCCQGPSGTDKEIAILQWNNRPDIKELNFTSTNKQSAQCNGEYMHAAKKEQGALYCRWCNKKL